ncbi:hypothetical protein ELH51_19060 [Rhizobium ruizarguesonis]|nr:hypothetical protein ELH51_19060 [Rhizobium ruizarguesonis]
MKSARALGFATSRHLHHVPGHDRSLLVGRTCDRTSALFSKALFVAACCFLPWNPRVSMRPDPVGAGYGIRASRRLLPMQAAGADGGCSSRVPIRPPYLLCERLPPR